jgi:hypothetical protein
VSRAAAVHVRDAVPEDAAATAAIGAAGFRGSYATILAPGVIDAVIEQTYSPSAIADCIRRCAAARDGQFLVAEREGQVVGFLHFDSEGAEPELHRIYIERTQERGRRLGARPLAGRVEGTLPAF